MERCQLLRLPAICTRLNLSRPMPACEWNHGGQAVEGYALLHVERFVARYASDPPHCRWIKV